MSDWTEDLIAVGVFLFCTSGAVLMAAVTYKILTS